MFIANKVYGFSMGDANKLRKIIGKKLRDQIDEWEPKFIKAGVERNIPEGVTKLVFQTAKASADYQFCRSHGYAYSYITALSAYCKANYPTEFFLALCKNNQGDFEKINTIISELPYFGIKLLPPSLLKSSNEFSIEGRNIRYGLSAIKGISDSALTKLQNFKPANCTKFEMFQAALQSSLSTSNMSALIMSGALDDYLTPDTDRLKLWFEYLLYSKLKDKEQVYILNNHQKYNSDLVKAVREILEWKHNDKAVARRTRLETLRKECREHMEIYKENRKNPQLAEFFWESSLIGYSYSHTLKSIFSKEIPRLININEFNELPVKGRGRMIVQVVECHKAVSRKGGDYAKIIIKDDTGTLRTYLSSFTFEEYIQSGERLPECDDILDITVVRAQDKGMGFVEKIKIFDKLVYTKLAEIRGKMKKDEENKTEE